jgi:quercetin dioxygenase-like cupin family protein
MRVDVHSAEFYDDNRASRLFDIFPALRGQITVSDVCPLQFSGWHRHEKQYDVFAVIRGVLHVGLLNPQGEGRVVRLARGQSLHIPTGYWHCYKTGLSPATLIYYLSRKHDETDEFRASEQDIFDRFGFEMYSPNE